MSIQKLFILTLTILFFGSAVHAFDRNSRKKYHIALQVVNPVSATSKFGGDLEVRLGLHSMVIGYTDYIGAYAGKQVKFEYEKYIKTERRNEWMWYWKLVHGDAAFDSKKLSTIGDNSKVELSSVNYNGFGAGFGRRINMNHFFVLINLGVKYCNFSEDVDDNLRKYYNMFFTTGPGAYVDFNFRFGYQF